MTTSMFLFIHHGHSQIGLLGVRSQKKSTYKEIWYPTKRDLVPYKKRPSTLQKETSHMTTCMFLFIHHGHSQMGLLGVRNKKNRPTKRPSTLPNETSRITTCLFLFIHHGHYQMGLLGVKNKKIDLQKSTYKETWYSTKRDISHDKKFITISHGHSRVGLTRVRFEKRKC